MKFFFPAAFLLLLFCSVQAQQMLSFDRPTKKGDLFQAEVSLAYSREYKFVLSGPDKPIAKRESLSVTLFAGMKVLEVNSVGNPNRVELKITSAGGYINGKLFDSSLLAGKTVLGDMRGIPCVFTYADTRKKVSVEAGHLLAAVFHVPPENTLKNTLGDGVLPVPGKKWNISALPIVDALKNRGFDVKGASIDAMAKIDAKESYRGIPCWNVTVNILSRDVANLDFRLKADLWIPVDPKLNVIRTIRSGVEVIDRMLPMDDPLAAGSNIRVITNETMEAVLIPAPENAPLPKKTPSQWSDFILR